MQIKQVSKVRACIEQQVDDRQIPNERETVVKYLMIRCFLKQRFFLGMNQIP